MTVVSKTMKGKLMCSCKGKVLGQAISTETLYSAMLGQYLLIAQVEYTCETCNFKTVEFPMKWSTELDKKDEEIQPSLYPNGS